MSKEQDFRKALEEIYDIAFSSHLYLKMGIGRERDPLVNFDKIVNIIEVYMPDEDEDDTI